jgi:hypothetical protein
LTEKTIRVSVEFVPPSQVSVYGVILRSEIDQYGIYERHNNTIRDRIACVDEDCLRQAYAEFCVCGLHCDCAGEPCDDMEEYPCKKIGPKKCIDGDCDEHVLAYSFVDVETTIVTDRIKVFMPSRCHKCGSTWFADCDSDNEVIGAVEIYYDLKQKSPHELAREYGARTLMTWNEVKQYVEREFDLELNYEDGVLLRKEDYSDQMERIRLAAVSEPAE